MTELVGYARELEAEDEALATAIAEVEAARRAAAALRERAEHADAFRARLPEARTAAAEAVAGAEAELEQRVSDLRGAEAELERAEDEDAERAARRAVVRTRDLASSAERKLERLRGDAERLEEEARAVEAEQPDLERAAGELGGEGRPERGELSLADWAARVEAALLVARSGLETRRERVIREANELAASALGEPFVSASVSVVRERLERLCR